ncbi:MAG: 50S ribosomal protein L17 [Candidatus Wildermuthbacteria bacterium]|nr:50S ribosomal protein L17 [Candidatus Wildermuthbacteria bacterium]
MKKRKSGRKFSRETAQRSALFISLASSLFLKEKIRTTESKAKGVAGFADKQITIAKGNNVSARRLLVRFFTRDIVKKLVDEIAPKYKERKGGYARIIKLGPRKSDGARMAFIELVK